MSTSFVVRPLVYVAGPYTSPDPVANTHGTITEANALQATGLVTCVVPHMSLLWHLILPHEEDYWYDYDLALLARCDALLRMPGESPGSENEIRFARDRDMPVFHYREHLLEWAEDR